MRPVIFLMSGVAALTLAACNKAPDTTTTTDSATTVAIETGMAGDSAASGGMATSAAGNPMVGGAEMMPTKPIAANASAASNLTTLVSAVKQAGLVETLSGPGPFTVFAPTNDAFSKVPKDMLDGLMKPEAKAKLKKVLTYHVVAGTLTAADLVKKIKAGGGKATLKTVEGEMLTLTMAGDMIKIAGQGGSMATVTQADVKQSNGIVHVVDGVLTPGM